ncbi:hypothetical protein GPU89_39050 [Burkholderia cepacia]|nr:hypothetical protein [Burkholderia cepacia]NLA21366.1 hypothetical protein [Burkholderia cepacia]
MSDSNELFSERFCTEHLEEIVHLDRVRERASLLSDFTLDDFVRMDRRLLGHLRGLTLREATAWRCIRNCIDTQGATPGMLFAAGIVAFAGGDRGRLEEYRTWLDDQVPRYPLMEKSQNGSGLPGIGSVNSGSPGSITISTSYAD